MELQTPLVGQPVIELAGYRMWDHVVCRVVSHREVVIAYYGDHTLWTSLEELGLSFQQRCSEYIRYANLAPHHTITKTLTKRKNGYWYEKGQKISRRVGFSFSRTPLSPTTTPEWI
jgi:hypothetical protein